MPNTESIRVLNKETEKVAEGKGEFGELRYTISGYVIGLLLGAAARRVVGGKVTKKGGLS